jgi:Tfp pilus assembly protein PilO
MERLQQYRIPIAVAFGTLVLVLAVYVLWISHEGSKLSALNTKQAQLQVEQASLQTRIAGLRREKQDLGPTCAVLAQDLTEVPGTPQVDSFLQQVTALAVSSGDPNTPSISVTQAGATKAAAGVTSVGVQLTLTGTYGQMSAFLNGLYTFPRLFNISTISIAGGPVATGGSAPAANTPNFDLSITGDVYYTTGQQNACTSTR